MISSKSPSGVETMLRGVIDMLRQIMPADGEIKLLNRFQYRALKPTWPVAFPCFS